MLVAPDIYMPEYAKYMKVMDLYGRADNPLLIPETGNRRRYAQYVFAAIGHGAIGMVSVRAGPDALQQPD